MHFIDTHAHVYAPELATDIELVIKNAISAGIEKILMPAIDSASLEAMLKVEQQFPDHCIAMMGLHPCYVKENYKAELKLVEEWIAKRKFIAIGEIGLDYYWDKTFAKEQQLVFETQMQWALDMQLPIRRAALRRRSRASMKLCCAQRSRIPAIRVI